MAVASGRDPPGVADRIIRGIVPKKKGALDLKSGGIPLLMSFFCKEEVS